MFISQIVLVCAVIAVSQAAYSVAPGYPIGNTGLSTDAVTSQQSNILRSYGNLGQVASFSKTINTPYSSVSKSDVRVSNPGYAAVAHAPIAYNPYIARPALAHPAYVSPYHAPVVAKGKFKVPVNSFNDCSPVMSLTFLYSCCGSRSFGCRLLCCSRGLPHDLLQRPGNQLRLVDLKSTPRQFSTQMQCSGTLTLFCLLNKFEKVTRCTFSSTNSAPS